MKSRITAALTVGAIVVAAAGSGIAFGASNHHAVSASPHHAVRACSTKTGHRLGLLRHGKCAPGSTKVIVGARGRRGKTGPEGPGATFQQQTDPNNDVEQTLAHNVAGIVVHSFCGMAADVTIELEPASGTGTIDLYGTRSQNTTLNVVSLNKVASLSASGSIDAAFDVVARAGDGNFVDLRVSGLWTNSTCIITEVAVPTKPAT
jgi:uncharacterized low-complexity protein